MSERTEQTFFEDPALESQEYRVPRRKPPEPPSERPVGPLHVVRVAAAARPVEILLERARERVHDVEGFRAE